MYCEIRIRYDRIIFQDKMRQDKILYSIEH